MSDARWRLDGQVALVAGASAGIGRAIADELLGRGADVLLAAREEAALERAREELADAHPAREVLAFAADVCDDEERRALFDWVRDLGAGLHCLINNAGGNLTLPAMDYAEADWRAIFEQNLFAAWELCRLAHPLLTQHAATAILNVGSVSGQRHVRTGAPYGASKAGLHQLTRNLACEWASDGIRVNAVLPWYIRTRRTSSALADQDYLDEVLDHTPLGRVGSPEEVAAAAVFLCLPAAAYISGQCLAVDGGFLAHGF